MAERENTLAVLDSTATTDGVYDPRIVNGRKIFYDKSTPKGDFNLSPDESRNINRASGTILRNSIYQAADNVPGATQGTMGKLGMNLKAANDIAELANSHVALESAGRLPASKGSWIRKLVEAGVGAVPGVASHNPTMAALGAVVAPTVGESLLSSSFGKALEGPFSRVVGGAMINNPFAKNVIPSLAVGGANALTNMLGLKNLSQNQGTNGNNDQKVENQGQNIHDISLSQLPDNIKKDSAFDPATMHWSIPTDVPQVDPAAIGDNPKITLQTENQALGMIPGGTINPEYGVVKSQMENVIKNRQDILNQHLAQDGSDTQFVKDYPINNQQLDLLTDIILQNPKSFGPQNFSNLVKYVQSQANPDMGVAYGQMNQQQAEQTRSSMNRVTNFDIDFLKNFAQPTDLPAEALRKLQNYRLQKAEEYRQKAPWVNYSTATGKSANPLMTPTGIPGINPSGPQ